MPMSRSAVVSKLAIRGFWPLPITSASAVGTYQRSAGRWLSANPASIASLSASCRPIGASENGSTRQLSLPRDARGDDLRLPSPVGDGLGVRSVIAPPAQPPAPPARHYRRRG